MIIERRPAAAIWRDRDRADLSRAPAEEEKEEQQPQQQQQQQEEEVEGDLSNGDRESRSIFTWHYSSGVVFQRRDGGARQLPTRVRNYFKSAQPVRALRRSPRDMYPRQEAKSCLPSSRKGLPLRFRRDAESGSAGPAHAPLGLPFPFSLSLSLGVSSKNLNRWVGWRGRDEYDALAVMRGGIDETRGFAKREGSRDPTFDRFDKRALARTVSQRVYDAAPFSPLASGIRGGGVHG